MEKALHRNIYHQCHGSQTTLNVFPLTRFLCLQLSIVTVYSSFLFIMVQIRQSLAIDFMSIDLRRGPPTHCNDIYIINYGLFNHNLSLAFFFQYDSEENVTPSNNHLLCFQRNDDVSPVTSIFQSLRSNYLAVCNIAILIIYQLNTFQFTVKCVKCRCFKSG